MYLTNQDMQKDVRLVPQPKVQAVCVCLAEHIGHISVAVVVHACHSEAFWETWQLNGSFW